jgi:hypothetical protein
MNMQKMVSFWSFLLQMILFCGLFFHFGTIYADEASSANVFFNPQTTEIAAGSEFSVSVNISNVSDIEMSAFDVLYDPFKISFVSAQNGDFLCNNAQEDLMTATSTYLDDPTLEDLMVSCNSSSGPMDGGGKLVTLTFKALSEGNTNLSFLSYEDSSLLNSEWSPIVATWNNGIVTVTPELVLPTILPDITAPSIPSEFSVVPLDSSSSMLSWASSTDSIVNGRETSGVAGYKIYHCETTECTPSGEPIIIYTLSYSHTGLTASSTYAYAISSFDTTGNESPLSETIQINTFPEPTPTPSTSVSLSPAFTETIVGSIFSVSVAIADVVNLFGTAFDVLYDPTKLVFVSAEKGHFLENDSVETMKNTAVNPAGTLIVGYSRLAVDGIPTGVSGSGALMTLTFRALDVGQTTLAFKNNTLINTNTYPENTTQATWSSASVNISSLTEVSSSSVSGGGGGVGGGGVGGGGGSAPVLLPFSVSEESIQVNTTLDGAVISWETTHPSTGQVIYSAEGQNHVLNLMNNSENAPKYGYASTTEEFDTNPKKTSHFAVLTGLSQGTTYYYRVISRGSFSVSEESSFITKGVSIKTHPESVAVLPLKETQILSSSSTLKMILNNTKTDSTEENSLQTEKIQETAASFLEEEKPIQSDIENKTPKEQQLAAVGVNIETPHKMQIILLGCGFCITLFWWLSRLQKKKEH